MQMRPFVHPGIAALARLVVVGIAATMTACTKRAGLPPGASPVPNSSVEARPLPPVPAVNGRLEIRVVYPPAGASIASVDSNFIFGSIGTGSARLQINGVDVPVLPNGSFLGFLPLPAGDAPTYRLVAVRGSDTVASEHRLRRVPQPTVLPAGGNLIVDAASVTPADGLWRLPDDLVRVSLRAAQDATVELLSPRGRVGLVRRGVGFAADVRAQWLADSAQLMVYRGRDTVRVPVPRVTLLDEGRLPLGTVGVAPSTLPDSDRVVVARPVVGGTYKWFLQPGTVLPITARQRDAWRVRLDDRLDVWVDAAEIGTPVVGEIRPSRVAGNARVRSGDGYTDVVIPMASAPPWSVEIFPGRLELTLHGVTANTDIINYATADTLVERVTWQQETNDRARFTVTLRRDAWGYLARFERGAFTLRIRHAPRVDPVRPLNGLVIAVDAGHPPAGSTGPTGLYEAVATLPIAERLRGILESRGARVVMTRTGPTALGLGDRPMIARRAGAHAMVSIHLNALPDGVNPFTAHGTGTYYFTGHSVAMARAVQWGMVRRMGLRDLGINYDNLAVVRGTWMPSVLCEGAFLMIPEQEAALRTPEFQDAYATGVADGLERFFRERAVSQP